MLRTDDPTTAVIARRNQVALWPAARPTPHGWVASITKPTTADAIQWIESRVGPEDLAARLSGLSDVVGARVFRSQVAVELTTDAIRRLGDVQDTLEGWDIVFSDLYDEAGDETVGWVDFVTERPHTDLEMGDWIGAARRRLETLPRKRVAEIGCGTGLIARAVLASGRTEEYVATDLTDVASAADAWKSYGARIRTLQAPAHEAVAAIGPVDLTILHSVVQYFPSTEYAAAVLAAAVAVTAPGGHVYIGDVRHQALDEVLVRERASARDADDPGRNVEREVAEAVACSVELSFGPAWFERLAEQLPAVTRVDVVPRLGAIGTEMTRCRFDALLHVGCRDDSGPPEVTEVARLGVDEWSAMVQRGSAFRVLVPNGWYQPGGLTPEQLVGNADGHDGPGHVSLRLYDDGSDAFLDVLWRPEEGDRCAWGHGRLHEEWRVSRALTPRNHRSACAELLERVGLDPDDLDPGISLVLTDARGRR